MLVTDDNLIKTSWFEDVKNNLVNNRLDFCVFSSVSPNPRDFEVMAGAEFYASKKCNMILALGGGSVIDCAKGIGIVATNKHKIQYFEGVDKISKPMPPLVCIPTTAGTSADVSQFAIINRFEEKYKMAIVSKATVPDIALIDPLVLVSMDSFLTACTAMDALTHAIEAYVSNASSSFTDLYAKEAICLIHNNLPNCLNEPNDLQLRGKIMLASLYAGLAFSNASLGCVHSLAHSLGGYFDLPHGECNAIILPHVVGYNFDSAEDKFMNIVSFIGLPQKKKSKNEIKKTLVDYLIEYRMKVGINSNLTSKGVKMDDLSVLAKKAINDPCNVTNPREPSKSDLEVIFREAL
ncbi:MAG TPA: iron-containing alcohol dehydrogenase [Tenuifilaceae bacterium]|nr:iron-containing alcohol dehydrogenase [Tenuifilaceae bacterium]HRX69124.1 iron-containing alcohol dehydrogenase [Tenuifilaceae bacterium]